MKFGTTEEYLAYLSRIEHEETDPEVLLDLVSESVPIHQEEVLRAVAHNPHSSSEVMSRIWAVKGKCHVVWRDAIASWVATHPNTPRQIRRRAAEYRSGALG